MHVTTRGWGMLAGGSLLAALSAALQSLTTARIAALVLVVPIIAIAWSLLTQVRARRGGLRRELTPTTWQVDVPARVALTATGPRLPPWSSLRERVPATLRRRSHGPLGYTVLPSRRGRVDLGPAIVQRSDPLAITWWRQPLGEATSVLVWPRTEHVADDVVARALEATSPRAHGTPQRTLEDLTVREYRRGDDLHRIHWRSSARHGELMVRHDEPTTTRVLDVLVVLAGTEGGDDPTGDDVTEWAVSAAASMVLALLRNGYHVRVVTVAAGSLVEQTVAHEGDALDLLALAEATGDAWHDAVRSVLRTTSAGVVAVLDRPLAELVEALSQGGGLLEQSTALVVDPAAGAAPSAEGLDVAEVVDLEPLHRSGWLVGTARGAEDLADAWDEIQRLESR